MKYYISNEERSRIAFNVLQLTADRIMIKYADQPEYGRKVAIAMTKLCTFMADNFRDDQGILKRECIDALKLLVQCTYDTDEAAKAALGIKD